MCVRERERERERRETERERERERGMIKAVANPKTTSLAVHHELSPPEDPGSSLGQDSVPPSLGNRTAGSWSKDEEEAQQRVVSMATAAHARTADARCVVRSLVGLPILVASYQCVSAESLHV